MRNHLYNKWSGYYKKEGARAVMPIFWAYLDEENRQALADWIEKNYTSYKKGGKVKPINVEKELRKIKEYEEKGGDVEFFGQKYKKRGGDVEFFGQEYKRMGGDIEFFGQKYKKKGGVVDKFSDAYNDLVKELGFKKKGGDIEFFGNKYKKKGGVVEKFNKAYKDLVKELGFKRGGDVEFFGQDYKRMGGKVRKFKQGYNDRDDEALAMRRGKHKSQDYRARRNESKGELKHKMRRAYSDVDSMDRGNRYLKRGGDVDFFGQKFKKRGGDVDFFGQKYMKKGGETDWIQSVVDSPNFRKGAFTRKAKERGMSTEAFMKQVLSNPNRYDLRTRRQAQFMKNI